MRNYLARFPAQRDRSLIGSPKAYDFDEIAPGLREDWLERMGLVTSHEVAERLGVDFARFARWANSVGVKARGNRARLKLWDWDEVEAAGEEHGYPEDESPLVRYVCPVCEKPRAAPFVPEACPICVRRSLFTTSTEGDPFREKPMHCSVDGCNTPTKHRKPWCSEHVLTHSPYVRWLRGRLHS